MQVIVRLLTCRTWPACAPYPAVSGTGELSLGAFPIGSPQNQGCEMQDKVQTYARKLYYRDKVVLGYTWFMPKSQPLRHPIEEGAGNVKGHSFAWPYVLIYLDAIAPDARQARVVASHNRWIPSTFMSKRNSNLLVRLYYSSFEESGEYAITGAKDSPMGLFGSLLNWEDMDPIVKNALNGAKFTDPLTKTDWPCPLRDSAWVDFVADRWPF